MLQIAYLLLVPNSAVKASFERADMGLGTATMSHTLTPPIE